MNVTTFFGVSSKTVYINIIWNTLNIIYFVCKEVTLISTVILLFVIDNFWKLLVLKEQESGALTLD